MWTVALCPRLPNCPRCPSHTHPIYGTVQPWPPGPILTSIRGCLNTCNWVLRGDSSSNPFSSGCTLSFGFISKTFSACRAMKLAPTLALHSWKLGGGQHLSGSDLRAHWPELASWMLTSPADPCESNQKTPSTWEMCTQGSPPSLKICLRNETHPCAVLSPSSALPDADGRVSQFFSYQHPFQKTHDPLYPECEVFTFILVLTQA